MNIINRLFVLPFITPLIIIIVIGAMNSGKQVSLKLLIWTTPKVSLGSLMAIGAGGSAILTSIAGLTVTTENTKLNRKVILNPFERKDVDNVQSDGNETITNRSNPNDSKPYNPPERSIKDPSPTVSVPFKVLKKGSRATRVANSMQQNDFEYDTNSSNNEEYYDDTLHRESIDNDEWGPGLTDEW